jgi:hypothetical protein
MDLGKILCHFVPLSHEGFLKKKLDWISLSMAHLFFHDGRFLG